MWSGPAGLPASEMTAKQQQTLMALIEEYAVNLPAELAAKRMQAAKSTPNLRLIALKPRCKALFEDV